MRPQIYQLCTTGQSKSVSPIAGDGLPDSHAIFVVAVCKDLILRRCKKNGMIIYKEFRPCCTNGVCFSNMGLRSELPRKLL